MDGPQDARSPFEVVAVVVVVFILLFVVHVDKRAQVGILGRERRSVARSHHQYSPFFLVRITLVVSALAVLVVKIVTVKMYHVHVKRILVGCCF